MEGLLGTLDARDFGYGKNGRMALAANNVHK